MLRDFERTAPRLRLRRRLPRLDQGARPSNGELEGHERETDLHGVNSMRVFILR